MARVHRSALCVAADHPCLPGHFPGNPVVPGVVLLDLTVQAAERWLGRALCVAGLPQVKFLAPLRPQETADVVLELEGAALRFGIERAGAPIAQGVLTLGGEAPE